MSTPAQPDVQARRRSFNDQADAYAVARPPYPDEVYHILTDHCGLRAGSRVLEIGPGAGLATEHLLARGAEVVAVEPGRRLAAVLRQRLGGGRVGGGRLEVVEADFEVAEVPAGAYDLAVSATAFHWVDAAAALPKLAGVLAPGGWLVVWWTVFGDPDRRTEFRTRLNHLYQRQLPQEWLPLEHVPGPLRTGSWTAELRQGGWFGEVDVDLIRWSHRLTPERARELFGSFPNIHELDPPRREAFLDAIAGLVEDLGGQVEDPYVTALYRCRPAGQDRR